MCVVIDSKVIISNVFYAYFQKSNKCTVLAYEDIENFKRILYTEISGKFGYVMFSGDDSSRINVYEHLFIRGNDGIICVNKLDDSFINRVNSIYPLEIQEVINNSRNKIMLEAKS